MAGLFIFREMRETPSVVLEPDQVVDAKENNPSSVTNLIEGYSLQKASLAGKWWRHSGALFCESSEQALIEFPADLADEYVLCKFIEDQPNGPELWFDILEPRNADLDGNGTTDVILNSLGDLSSESFKRLLVGVFNDAGAILADRFIIPLPIFL